MHPFLTPRLPLPPSPRPQVREFLEKHFTETRGMDTIKLALKALMETVEAGSKSLEVRGDRAPAIVHMGWSSDQSTGSGWQRGAWQGHREPCWVEGSLLGEGSLKEGAWSRKPRQTRDLLPLPRPQVAVMERGSGLRILSDEEVDNIVKVIEEEKAAAEAAKRTGGAGPSAS